MEGISAIWQRIAQIQTTLATFGAPAGQAAVTSPSPSETFAAALDAAVTELSGSAPAAGPTGLTADGVPAELATYGNGRIPREALEPVDGTGHRLWRPAGEAFERLLAAARADGVTIGITDSYRSYEVQVDVVRRKGLYSQGGLGAAPGTSRHGWGMAVDLDLDGAGQGWMRANAARFGFTVDPRESWHWNFAPAS